MVSISTLPEMLESIEEDQELSSMTDRDILENTISGLFITFQSIGESIGPILNSVLVEYFGFMRAYEFYCLYLFSFCVLYFALCGHFNICSDCKNSNEVDYSQEVTIQI